MLRRLLNHQWAPLGAFLILALAGGGAISAFAQHAADVNYQTALANCQRIEQLRIESNRRIHSHQVSDRVIFSFLESAEAARRAGYGRTHQASDLKAVREYQKLQVKISHVHFNPLPLINCKKAIIKP